MEVSPLLQRVVDDDPYLDVVQVSADAEGAIKSDDATPRLREIERASNFFIILG